jgi:hypothetical protein
MTRLNEKLSEVKQDVTTEIHKCYHFCQFCFQKHYHWRGIYFVGNCKALNTLSPTNQAILIMKGFPRHLLPWVAGMCPDCRYKAKMTIQFRNQGRISSQNLKNLKGPGTNFV